MAELRRTQINVGQVERHIEGAFGSRHTTTNHGSQLMGLGVYFTEGGKPENPDKNPYRDLKQTRTATAVNKQLNFTVKNKPQTTNYIYCIFEAYFMIKSV